VTHIFFRRELKPTRRVPAIQLRAETPKNRAQRSGRYPNHRSFGLGATSVSQTRRAGGPICTCPEGKLLDPVRSSSAADRRIIHALEPQRDEDPSMPTSVGPIPHLPDLFALNSIESTARAECAYAPPLRISAAIQAASLDCCAVLPC
jgi:hypothetical protein